MLGEIRAKNFALFEDLDIMFSDKMNAITGETGAGKSLFLSILKILLGEKNEFITEKSEIEARFFVDEGEFLVNIRLTPSRMSPRINGAMVTLSELKNLVSKWMDIHNQGVSDILRDPKMHLKFVDLFNPAIAEPLEKYRELYRDYMKIQKIVKDKSNLNIASEIHDLPDEIEKISKILMSDEEYETLKNEYKRLSNAREIIQKSKDIDYLITGENALEPILEKVIDCFRELEMLDPSAKQFFNEITSIEMSIHSIEKEVSRYAALQEFDVEKFNEIEDRISEIERAKRRYGPTLEDVRKHLEEMKERLDLLNGISMELEKENEHLKRLIEQMNMLSSKIKEMRHAAATDLVKKIHDNLKDLSMPKAKISFVQTDTNFTEDGADYIEFFGSMNPGTQEMPISRIASGGEMSRFYLAIESSIGSKLPISTIVFDEIEAGIGVRNADIIASKMVEMSENTQLIVITHMPQIAAVADKHFKVEKYQLDGKTFSTMKEITGNSRKKEIKEMFGKSVKTF